MADIVLCAFIHDGFPSFFITGGKTSSSYFLCLLLTYLGETVGLTCRAIRLLVCIGCGGWNLRGKYLWLVLMNLLAFVLYFGMF